MKNWHGSCRKRRIAVGVKARQVLRLTSSLAQEELSRAIVNVVGDHSPAKVCHHRLSISMLLVLLLTRLNELVRLSSEALPF